MTENPQTKPIECLRLPQAVLYEILRALKSADEGEFSMRMVTVDEPLRESLLNQVEALDELDYDFRLWAIGELTPDVGVSHD